MNPDKRMPVVRMKKTISRSSSKLLFILLFFFLTLLVILFMRSSFSKITEIEINGMHHLQSDEIKKASGIHVGDHYLAVGKESVRKRVMQLGIVQSVEIRKRFPGLLAIEVQEYPEVAFLMTAEGDQLAVLANGAKVPIHEQNIIDKPILTGWSNDEKGRKRLCKTLAAIPTELLSDISEIIPSPSAAYSDKIKMYTRSRFEVTTTISKLPDKLDYLSYIIAEKEPGYVVMLEADYHSPYEKDKSVEVDATEVE